MTDSSAISGSSLAGRRILIVGLNYWPEETGNAPYTTGLAEHLAAQGAEVSVLCGLPYYPQWRVADSYRGRWRIRERRHDVEIHRFRQYVPSRQTALRRSIFEATFLAHAATASRLPRPDLILGILPSLSDGVLTAVLTKRFRAPYGLLVQDLVGRSAAQSGIAGGGRVARATAAIEASVARGATTIGIVSDGFRDALREYGVDPRRITIVPNWSHVQPPAADPTTVRAEFGWTAADLVVLHAGNMGLKQGLENVVDAARLAATQGRRHRFVLMGDGNQRSLLQARAADFPNLQFLPPQPAERFMNILAAADILLVNERGTVVDMSLPSKLTSYFVAGRPVIAAVAPHGATAREVARSGGGVTVPGSDPSALVNAIEHLASDPVRRQQLGDAGRRYAAEHLAPAPALTRAQAFVESILRSSLEPTDPVTERTAGLSHVESI